MRRENFTRRYQSEYNWYRIFSQFYSIWFVCKPFWSLFYKVEVIGRDNIPKDRKIILAANHISYFDPFLVFMSTWKPVAFMAKKELFERSSKNTLKAKILDNWRIGWLDRLGAFAVNREKLEVSTIKTAKDALKTKRWTLGIFPQGGIRKNKKIENINRGFIAIAKMMKVPILPLSISGLEQYNWNPFNRKPVEISIGEPISYELSEEEIINNWANQISSMAKYELGEI